MKNILLGDLEHSSENHISTKNGFLKIFIRAQLFRHLVPYILGFIWQINSHGLQLRKEDCMQDFEVVKYSNHVPYPEEFFN